MKSLNVPEKSLELILAKTKSSLVRQDVEEPRPPAIPGEELTLGVQTGAKQAKTIASAAVIVTVTAVTRIVIFSRQVNATSEFAVHLAGRRQTPEQLEELAAREGFISAEDYFDAHVKTHGKTPFAGWLIQWDPDAMRPSNETPVAD